MRPKARMAAACGASLALLGLIWMLFGDRAPESGAPSALDLASEAPPAAGSPPVPDPPLRQEHRAEDPATHDGATIVVVRDLAGSPVVGADVRLVKSGTAAASPRRWPIDASDVTIRCDDRGVATFLPTIAAGHTLIATHPSHSHAHHPVVSEQKRIDITLSPAATLRVRCRTRDGGPLSGVRVSASSRPFTHLPAEDALSHVPGPNPATAIHEAVSSSDGTAEIRAVLPGRVYVAIHHGTYVATGLLNKQPLTVQAGITDLEESFDPIVGIHAAMSGDSIATWNMRVPKSIVQDPRIIRILAPLTASLQSERGDSLCVLGARRYDPASGDYVPLPETIRVTLLTNGRGVVHAQVRPQVGPNLYSIQEIQADASRPPVATELVSVMVLHPDGSQVLDTGMCILVPEDESLIGLSIPVPRRPLRLPLGHYTVRGHTAFLDRALGAPRITVAAGATQHTVTFSKPLVACRFLVTDDLGVEADAADITIVAGDAKESFSCDHGLPTRVYHLPPGELRIEVVARGCQPVSLAPILEANEAGQGTTSPRTLSVTAPRAE